MQRRWARRLSPRILLVALTSVVMVLSALAVSQADIGSPKPVSVATLAGGSSPLPADVLPGEDFADQSSIVPEAAPTADASTTTTAGESTTTTAARAGNATAAAHPCPKPSSPKRPCPPPCAQPAPSPSATAEAHRPACPPPCSQPGSANTNGACPPPCARPGSPSSNGSTEPARPACPPPPCGQTDPAYGCAPPPPCAYPTEPDGGIGNSKPAIMIYCPPPCSSEPGSQNPCPPPCERDASCPQPCYEAKPAPASTPTAGGTDPVPPSQSCPPPPQPCPAYATADGKPAPCPPPCPSATATDQSCTPPCSYPGSDGQAAGGFAPCPAGSGVTGRVTAGPTCPVERPDQPCADKPVETTLRLLREDGSVAATAKSAPDGTFKMAAAPGNYRLVADWPSRVGGCAPVEVTVERGRFTSADVSCDTGIR